MTNVRALLTRVAKLEKSRAAPRSPIEQSCGSLEAFEADTQAGIAAGRYDSHDMPLVLGAIRKWHRDQVWGNWQYQRNGAWEHGGR